MRDSFSNRGRVEKPMKEELSEIHVGNDDDGNAVWIVSVPPSPHWEGGYGVLVENMDAKAMQPERVIGDLIWNGQTYQEALCVAVDECADTVLRLV